MKIDRKDFQLCRDNIYIIPTINIVTDDLMLRKRNFSIQFHFLTFHARIRWIGEKR